MKAARQVIRSQAARDYAERELVHAEATIQELRTKLHHALRERDAALEAARLATAAKLAAQRSMLEAEASRDRSDRVLRAGSCDQPRSASEIRCLCPRFRNRKGRTGG
jgi:predicted ATPase